MNQFKETMPNGEVVEYIKLQIEKPVWIIFEGINIVSSSFKTLHYARNRAHRLYKDRGFVVKNET